MNEMTLIHVGSYHTRTESMTTHMLQTGMRVFQSSLKDSVVGTTMVLGGIALSASAYSAGKAISALSSGKTNQAKKWALLSATTFAVGIVSGYNLYRNVNAVAYQKEFFNYNWRKDFFHSTQEYNRYGQEIGSRKISFTGDCYQDDESRTLCFQTLRRDDSVI